MAYEIFWYKYLLRVLPNSQKSTISFAFGVKPYLELVSRADITSNTDLLRAMENIVLTLESV